MGTQIFLAGVFGIWAVLGIIGLVVLAAAALCGIIALLGHLGYKRNMKLIDNVKPLSDSAFVPHMDAETGCWTFNAGADFKVLQLSDVHIGCGIASIGKDAAAIKTVEEIVTRAKPDLVIVTGDMVFPFPIKGCLNNKKETGMFIKLMEKLNVYWTVAFGNHDVEFYTFYNRAQIAEYYESLSRNANPESKCLFSRGDKEIYGEGNHIINVADADGKKILQSLILVDTNSYVEGGLLSNYDGTHQDQIDWYEKRILELSKINEARGGDKVVKSLMFLHIPLREYLYAWKEYTENGRKDTENVIHHYGDVGEKGGKICASRHDNEMFNTITRLGSTQGVFCGHDHLNTFSLTYKGIRLSFGLSVDYLAYIGIHKAHDHRGGTVISIGGGGEYELKQEFLGTDYKGMLSEIKSTEGQNAEAEYKAAHATVK